MVGTAAAGAVEAIESTGTGVVFGVEWHAECLVERSEHLALFEGLVRVGAQHAASGLRRA